ncbi:4920_t:CDS:2 [Ambispora gerdemannii]|uniref:4920_t:CDS:1 n=1 Tax=Ambispora gerdemannii TaxID=144530 RepID=A0A9N8YYM2_9GLOM|nr:4920_t:CDS:2 [Ambispora gerdemannii]
MPSPRPTAHRDSREPSRYERDERRHSHNPRSRSPPRQQRQRSISQSPRVKSRTRHSRSPRRHRSRSRSPPMRQERHRSRSRSPPMKQERHRSRSHSPSVRQERHRFRSRSPSMRQERHRFRSRSPPMRQERFRRDSIEETSNRRRSSRNSRSPVHRSRSPPSSTKSDKGTKKPNFGLSGKLAAETNTYNGVVLKYHEPPEARKPAERWRLYVFKGDEQVDLLHIHRQSAYLLGRDRLVADIPIDHPSCSKQHAVLQYRQISEKDEYGQLHSMVKPYVIDLESSNGTYVNSVRIPTTRYFELKLKDVLKFGFSTREYVLMHEEVKEGDEDEA